MGTRNFKGDANEKPTLAPVPASAQRQAMRMIVQSFFAPDAFDLPSSVMENLSLNDESGSWNAPLREILSGMEENMLALSMSAVTTDRIAENAYKAHDRNAYSLSEHYDSLLHSVFSEAVRPAPITPLRRDLQTFFVNALMLQAGAPEGGVNDDVRLVSNDDLKRLDTCIQADLRKPSSFDQLSRLHLQNTESEITRFLDRKAASSR